MRIIFYGILVTFSVTANAMPFSQIPAQAQSTSVFRSASNAVEQRIEGSGRVQVAYEDYWDISDVYQDSPAGRPHEYLFGLNGQGVLDVLNSPVTASDMAGIIFESCGDIGAVSFGVYQTGIAYTLGWSSDGEWIEFECHEADDYAEKTPWGQKFCT